MQNQRLTKLDDGDVFPPLSVETLDHGSITLPTGQWTVLLIYRGVW